MLAEGQSMSVEGDHHYVPQFHLRNWENKDREITQWGRIAHSGKLVRRPVPAAGTAYSPGLYSLEQVDLAETQQVETKILGQIEDRASPVLRKFVREGRVPCLWRNGTGGLGT